MNRHAAKLLAPGLFALLMEPLAWLVHTWISPAYDSPGALVALLAALMVLRSVRSGALPDRALGADAAALLLGAALIRLAGRLLAVNHLGALALLLDAWALARLLRLESRPWPLSPAGLALLVGFALPAEQVLQRVLAWPLRLSAAALTHAALRPFVDDLRREGTVLSRPGLALSVDLPCSGAQGLVLLGLALAVFACTREVSPRRLAGGAAAVALGALVANALRIGALVLVPAWIEEPAHTIVGLAGLAVGTLPLLAVARRWSGRRPRPLAAPRSLPLPAWAAAAFSALAIAISLAPHHPLDVSDIDDGPRLPRTLGALYSTSLPLTDEEERYFQRYGGLVEKRAYDGPNGLRFVALLARSSAPLRHLHDPEVCLRGAGHAVTKLGVREAPALTAVWRSVDPQGQSWRVEASFVSDAGEQASTGSEVAWRWLAQPSVGWMQVQRITPFETCDAQPAACAAFEMALLRALDVEVKS